MTHATHSINGRVPKVIDGGIFFWLYYKCDRIYNTTRLKTEKKISGNTMSARDIWILAAALALLVFLSRDALARFFWHEFRQPAVALALVRQDADLAVEIGNYYFNGGRVDAYTTLTPGRIV